MNALLSPIRAKSLKWVFIERFETMILSGKLEAGQKLPSERELAKTLGVSRPVVHEGLLELATRGLVTMKPRVGTVVNDYRTNGSLTIMSTLLNHYSGTFETKLLYSMIEMHTLFESETVRLAARHRTEEQLQVFYQLLKEWEEADIDNVDVTTDLYFRFHHHIAMASGNLFYPLLLNSFKNFYITLTRQSFIDASIMPVFFSHHKKIVEAIARKDEASAVQEMKDMITSGEKHLKNVIDKRNGKAEVLKSATPVEKK
jgi:DNA-binding FadR family transcriptional regulator